MKNVTGNIVPPGCKFPSKCVPDNHVYVREAPQDANWAPSGKFQCVRCELKGLAPQPTDVAVDPNPAEMEKLEHMKSLFDSEFGQRWRNEHVPHPGCPNLDS